MGLLLAVLVAGSSAIGDPVSGAPSVGAAAVVASDERAWAGAVSREAEPDVGGGSAAVGSLGADLLDASESLALDSLDLGAAACCAGDGSVRDGELLSLTGDCGVGIGVCVDVGGGVGIGEKEVGGEMLKAGLWETGLELLPDESAGWSEELLESDDGAASVSGVAGVGGAGVKGAAATGGD